MSRLLGGIGWWLLAVGLGAGTLALAGFFQAPPAKAAGCPAGGSDHIVIISHADVIPQHTDGRRCDRLTIINRDKVLRLIAFGPHTHHMPYDGVTEKVLYQNQELTVQMVQTGSFSFHDHIHDWVVGTFTVR